MQDVIFREYDIRGKVGSELLVDQMYDLTCAIFYFFKQKNPSVKRLAIGMDGRVHSEAIKMEVCRALIDCGIDVFFVGVCPSPALYFALYTMQVDGGLMITASHNTKEYNGIKICLGTEVVWGQNIQAIKQLYHEKKRVTSAIKGTLTDAPIVPKYTQWLVDHFQDLKGMPLHAIIDCGNGAAGTVLPGLMQAMHWNHVSLLFPEVDGTYPNHEADPTVLENMLTLQKTVVANGAELGIGLDGDCDRMVPMTKQGDLVSGDMLLALFVHDVLQRNPGSSIVFDIKSSAGLVELINEWGGKPVMSPSGHSIIKEMMLKHNAALGGELSCHFFFKDGYFGYDDGIYTMLRLFRLLLESRQSLQKMLLVFPKKYSSRELRLPVSEHDKKEIIVELKNQLASRKDISLVTIDGIRVQFSHGWGIIRPSNTQAALSMRFEGDSKTALGDVMTSMFSLLKGHLSETAQHTFTTEMDRVCG